MGQRVLIVNAGSSSVKLRVIEDDDRLSASTDAQVDDLSAIAEFVRRAGSVTAIGHRVVHGGPWYDRPVQLDGGVLAQLEALVPLAPLHQPRALAAIRQVGELLTGRPAFACFDTAFHRTLDAAARTYPLPRSWTEQYGIRRYGFHGLSHAFALRRTGELLGRPPPRLLSCHLGSGSSITAIVHGRSVATTMGFTPNSGVPMATRAGDLDADLLLWLLHCGLDVAELQHGVQHRCGLTAMAGTGDMSELLRRAPTHRDAALAIEVWVLRVAQAIAAMAVAAGGVEVLTFTGGIGSGSPELRLRIAGALTWLGIELDPDANLTPIGGHDAGSAGASDRMISSSTSRVRCAVVTAREDLEMARSIRSQLDSE